MIKNHGTRKCCNVTQCCKTIAYACVTEMRFAKSFLKVDLLAISRETHF